MNRVLVYGLKDPAGGVEQVVMEYAKSMTAQFDISFDFIVFSQEFSLEKEIEGLGCRVVRLPVRRKNLSGYKKAMAALFETNQYCAVWGNYSGLTNIDILTLAKKHGVPVRIVHSHVSRLYWGSAVMKYVVHVLHAYNKSRLTRYATHYFACSRVAMEFMIPQKVQTQTVFLRNAVDTARFCPDAAIRQRTRATLGIAENAVVVGHVARMCDVKNQSFLLKIMAQIAKQAPDARLLFVGDGELRPQLEEKARQLGITDRVIFTGSRRDVPDLLRAMDVYVLTSFSEGLSVSAVEAQASGLPCVLSAAVSEETDVSGAVRFVSLEESTQVWADAILAQAAGTADDPGHRLAEHGYEITSAARRLHNMLTGENL